jgi:hypothetical protein
MHVGCGMSCTLVGLPGVLQSTAAPSDAVVMVELASGCVCMLSPSVVAAPSESAVVMELACGRDCVPAPSETGVMLSCAGLTGASSVSQSLGS